MADEKETVQIAFFGPSGAGKTALINALQGNDFIDDSRKTMVVDFKFFEPSEVNAKVRFLDCPGEKKFSPAKNSYLQDSAAIYLVLDANKLPTKESVKQDWVDVATSDAPGVPVYLVINKNDSDDLTALAPKLADLASIEGISIIEPNNKEARWLACSAKTGNIAPLEQHVTKVAQAELDKIADNHPPKEVPQVRKLNLGDPLDDATDANSSAASTPYKPQPRISKKKINPAAKSFFLQFAKLFRRHFGTSGHSRVGFLIAVVGVSAMVFAGALGGSFAFLAPLLVAVSIDHSQLVDRVSLVALLNDSRFAIPFYPANPQ